MFPPKKILSSLFFSFSTKKPPSSSTHINTKLESHLQKGHSPPIYIVNRNYNFERYKEYAKKVNSALDQVAKNEDEKKEKTVERRRRRVYDRPKFNMDLKEFSAWRIYDSYSFKAGEGSLEVVTKLYVAPAAFRRTFGLGTISKRSQEATREYDFQDSDFSKYIIYDCEETTDYWGPNDPNYDYEHQDHITPRKRKIKYPTSEEFWALTEPRFLRVNASRYADFRRFKFWILENIKKNTANESFDEKFIRTYGPVESYDDYDKNYELIREATVFKYDRRIFVEKGEKVNNAELEYHSELPKPKVLGEEFKLKKAGDIVGNKN